MGRNVMRQQLQSGRVNMPSMADAVKDTGAIDFELAEGNDDTLDSQDCHDNRPHSPQIVTNPEDALITDLVLPPLVVHYQLKKKDTPL